MGACATMESLTLSTSSWPSGEAGPVELDIGAIGGALFSDAIAVDGHPSNNS